jgi:large subunit ribosomal protein L28
VTRRGLPKAKGGVGLKTTGITRRSFKPNIQTVRVLLPNGGLRRMKLAASVIKKGEVKVRMNGRMVTVPLVKAPHGRQREYLSRRRESAGK